MPGSARDEAERLVATVLAMAGSSGARDQVGKGLSALAETLTGAVDRLASVGSSEQHKPAAAQRSGWATGSAECCVCPVCKAIAAARNPSPATAVRLVTGAGDLATGAARLLRGLSSMAGDRPKRAPTPPPPPPSPDEAWSAATREPASRPGDASATAPDADPWAAASAAGAAAAEADRAEARARREAAEAQARREAAETARVAAREAARRVAEAAALAEKAKEEAGGDAASSRTAEGFDVWAAATAPDQDDAV
jgi:hypothetical protein